MVYEKSADRRKAEKRSPLELVARIKAPLLVAHSPSARNLAVAARFIEKAVFDFSVVVVYPW